MVEDNMLQPVLFGGLVSRPVIAVFDQPDSSSDAGALLLHSADRKLGLIQKVTNMLSDTREASRVRHSLADLLSQRVYGIACGYEDGNDAARLRDDPIHKLLLARDPLIGDSLASQPSISRFENGLSAREVLNTGYAIADAVIERHKKRLGRRVKRITIDLDSTEDRTHGNQQGSLFNGFYGSHCYLPLLGFLQFNDEGEQYLFTSLLQTGTADVRAGALGILKRVLPRLQAAFPRASVLVRLDAGFSGPALYEYLESEGLMYVTGMKGNPKLKGLAEPLMQESRTASADSGVSERHYGEAQYQAGTWNKARRVVIKAEVTRYPGRNARDNARYLITNCKGKPASVYERVYSPRGDVENRIKELKNTLNSDRTSCTRFMANQMRLFMAGMAFIIYQELRLHAAGTSLAKAQVGTLRERLIKLGGWIRSTTRRITLHLPQEAPWQDEWRRIAAALHAPPA